ncbi:MAG: primosomal protein N', partial [Bacteroidia bacterium]|nr:primosomal protein N' [Bacteroidia bacterium]
GELLRVALPAGLKINSQTWWKAGSAFQLLNPELSSREYLLLETIQQQGRISTEEAGQILGLKNPTKQLAQLQAKQLIEESIEIIRTYNPKLVRCVLLSEEYQHSEPVNQIIPKLSEKQQAIFLAVLQSFLKQELLPVSKLLNQLQLASESSVQTLVKKGIIRIEQLPIDRLNDSDYQPYVKEIELTASQKDALSQLREFVFAPNPKPTLLYGITGSGKTHLYIELIQEIIQQGKQALYLLPEIALTKQIINRVKTTFGEKAGVYHSRFTDAERVEIWQKVISGEYQVVIGVRSAIFLPFANLGLIIVDEEHDHSFKQSELKPRYHARDTAVVYAHQLSIPIVLGSATPSIESYENALQKKYQLVTLKERAANAQVPSIQLIDLSKQFKHKLSYGLFSEPLIQQMQQTLQQKEQIILFQNRRGYAPMLVCNDCGYVPRCRFCDISLTYHKKENYLRCHYCGYTDPLTRQCSICGSFEIKPEGIGTERLEIQLKELFPQARIERMDLDTTKSKNSLSELIYRMERQEIDILVGTQMVTKGLDLPNVTLTVVVDADRQLNYPDFRSYETSYQLYKQFAGRAGRSEKKGKFLVQTRNPNHPILKLLNQDFEDFFQYELRNRQTTFYPPFSRLIRIEVQHKDRPILEQEALRLQQCLQPQLGNWLLGPEFPLVAKIRSYYRMQFLIKIPRQTNVTAVKKSLLASIEMFTPKTDKTLKLIVDVDPR